MSSTSTVTLRTGALVPLQPDVKAKIDVAIDRLEGIVENHLSATDGFSSRLIMWGWALIELKLAAAGSEEFVRNVGERVQELVTRILVDEMVGTPLREPVVVHGWVLERAYVQWLRTLDGKVVEGEYPEHAFAQEMVEWIGALAQSVLGEKFERGDETFTEDEVQARVYRVMASQKVMVRNAERMTVMAKRELELMGVRESERQLEQERRLGELRGMIGLMRARFEEGLSVVENAHRRQAEVLEGRIAENERSAQSTQGTMRETVKFLNGRVDEAMSEIEKQAAQILNHEERARQMQSTISQQQAQLNNMNRGGSGGCLIL